jgi:Holliday junction resolvase-like predicted endonuclease
VTPSKNTECLISTENLSAALKSTSNNTLGKATEDFVAEFLISKKWNIVSQRQKYKFGEIDLIVQRKNNIAIIEVKTLKNEWSAFERIHDNQVLRLQKNFIYLSKTEFKKFDVKLMLCFVGADFKISWVDLIGS